MKSLSRVRLFATPWGCSPPGSSIHGILQARILEWVAISFPGDLCNPGIESSSPALQADALTSEPAGKPWIYNVCPKSLLSCPTLRPHGLQAPRLPCPSDSPGKNTGVGNRTLFQGIFWPRDQIRVSTYVSYGQAGPLPLTPSAKCPPTPLYIIHMNIYTATK